MREILFRAKTVDTNEWVEGYYYTNYLGSVIRTRCSTEEVNPETLGQFTGLYDKKGVKIFEGDIVRCTYYGDIRSNRAVVFIDGEYLLESKGDYIAVALYEKEVIGNIYDNRELLKEE